MEKLRKVKNNYEEERLLHVLVSYITATIIITIQILIYFNMSKDGTFFEIEIVFSVVLMITIIFIILNNYRRTKALKRKMNFCAKELATMEKL